MHTQKSFGVFVVSLISIIIIGLAVNGCGTVKRETGGGGSSGGNGPATTITAADCVWTTMNATTGTGLSWGSLLYLDIVSGNVAVAYDYQNYYGYTNRIMQVWTGTGWAAPVSGDTTTRPVWYESTCTSNGSEYKATLDNSMSYQPKIFITKDGVTVATINESVFGDSYQSMSLQVVNEVMYIAYTNYNVYDNSRSGVYVKKINAGGTAEPIDQFIYRGIFSALKVVSDTEAYLAYTPNNYYGNDIVVLTWSPKK